MTLPLCEICQTQNANIWIYLQHQGQTEQHHVCLACAGQATAGDALAAFFNDDADSLGFKSMLHKIQHWQELSEDDEDDDSTLQKLQELMGSESGNEPTDLFDGTDETTGISNESLADMEPSMEFEHCRHCHTSWASIHRDGLLGCPHCYSAFATQLQEVLKQLHHNNQHIGKIPRFWQKQERLRENQQKRQQHRREMLQRRLDAAVQAENYEEAAQIRDKIAQISETNS